MACVTTQRGWWEHLVASIYFWEIKTMTAVSDFRYWGLNHENIISIYNISNHDRR